MSNELLFALDIGTRSIVGLVGEQTGSGIRLIATEREEHHTRAMLDGQIHDVTEVASVLASVKTRLEQTCGPLSKVAIAAAGRALYTVRAQAEIDISSRGFLTTDDERALELAAIQAAQQQLATSNSVADPTGYYCVGYSIVHFSMDGTVIKSLVGQRGKKSGIEIIATFLPRPVIDSLQAALLAVDLEMSTLTLEPIAAINVLIPPTMRHLNLALVDVGAGTSDVAITRNGSVVGYGMVPCAGDEITEALSQKYLLDFNVAETVKRELGTKKKRLRFFDVLGCEHREAPQSMIDAITATVAELAQAIAGQILALNTTPPQAVLLVGGGSLTPLLPAVLAQALDIPAARVGIRRPDSIQDISGIPPALYTPDAVTPLGILKLAGSHSLNFVNVLLNGEHLHLFNLGTLTVADALLAAGIDIRTLHGRPGLGITITVNNQTHFLPGSHGTPGVILCNGQPATFDDPLNENDCLTVNRGASGNIPRLTVAEVTDLPAAFSVVINKQAYDIAPLILINEAAATPQTILADRDQVIISIPSTLQEILATLGMLAEPCRYDYTINSIARSYTVSPQYTINGQPAELTSAVAAHNIITITPPAFPSIAELAGIAATIPDDALQVTFDGRPCPLPRRRSITLNGKPAKLTDLVPPGSTVTHTIDQSPPIVSDVLLAADFNPRTLSPGSRVTLLLNGQPAEYISPVKNGDRLDIQISIQ